LYREDVLGDKAFIEEMKADILRRAEAISDDEDEESEPYIQDPANANASNKGKSKLIEILNDDDDDAGLVNSVRIVGDGEESDVDEEDDEEQAKSPEMILELAYLRDPKVFERDAVTRRSKARTDLKNQTGIAVFYSIQSLHLNNNV
jgi:activating signal cointegrator complex subunit 2